MRIFRISWVNITQNADHKCLVIHPFVCEAIGNVNSYNSKGKFLSLGTMTKGSNFWPNALTDKTVVILLEYFESGQIEF